MAKPRMTKSEKVWFLANFQNVKAGLLNQADTQKWVSLSLTKTF